MTEIFLVTYSILYGIMLNGCLSLNLFPFGQLGKNPKAKRRIGVSLMLVNVIPALIFAVIYNYLEGVNSNPPAVSVIGVFLISMIVFAPYRFLHACIVFKPTWFYYKYETCKIFKKVPLEDQTEFGHIFGVGLYILLAGIGFLFVVSLI